MQNRRKCKVTSAFTFPSQPDLRCPALRVEDWLVGCVIGVLNAQGSSSVQKTVYGVKDFGFADITVSKARLDVDVVDVLSAHRCARTSPPEKVLKSIGAVRTTRTSTVLMLRAAVASDSPLQMLALFLYSRTQFPIPVRGASVQRSKTAVAVRRFCVRGPVLSAARRHHARVVGGVHLPHMLLAKFQL